MQTYNHNFYENRKCRKIAENLFVDNNLKLFISISLVKYFTKCQLFEPEIIRIGL